MNEKTLYEYARIILTGNPVARLSADSDALLKELWKYEPLKNLNGARMYPLDIVCSENPLEDLARIIFEFCKKDYTFTNPLGESCKCNLPSLVENYPDVDDFVKKCIENSDILANVIYDIASSLPPTLLMGVHLSMPKSFFEKLKQNDPFFVFLKKLKASDYRLCVSGPSSATIQ